MEMVDFNSQETISKPPKDIVALIIIEKLYNFLEADEYYAKNRWNNANTGGLAISRARLRSLFLVSHEMLKRNLKEEVFKEVSELCIGVEKVEMPEVMKCFVLILEILDQLGLTKLDTKQAFNRHRVEEANKHHGY